MLRRRLFLAPILALAAGVCLAGAARGELVILAGGEVVKAAAYETDGEQARVTLPSGGRLTLAIERVERVVDDEVVPAPPAPVAAAVAPAALPLAFDASQPVPEGPYGDLIYQAARRHSINPQIVSAVIRAESAGNPRALSAKGARGLMQLMPSTAGRFGVGKEQLYDPERNLEAGIQYLKTLFERFPNDLARVLAAYNAGEGTVDRYNGIPPYRETRDYVRRIYTTLGLTVGSLTAAAGGR
ncbi:MAG TPA: lytic transglycosylase domain-containing protein [Thermoanaerobaculia bacterium]|nr:lytic transglycosylase domain-containing protein [Thermoanaerobaculia bacterium]